MAGKHNGEWPYHEDPHGNWVACSNNPCKLHSGGDIMASSPEDAMAKADRLAHPEGGGGYAGGLSKVMDKGAAEAHRFAEEREKRIARVEKAMSTFYDPPAELPPDLKKTYDGKRNRMGGKYLATRDESWPQITKRIRHDISVLRKAGGIPKGWKVKIGLEHDYESPEELSIELRSQPGTTRPYRSIRPTDIYDPNNEGEGKNQIRYKMEQETGIHDCTYEQAEEYCRKHPEIEVPEDVAEEAVDNVQKIADQYAIRASSRKTYDSIYEHCSVAILATDE